MEATPQVNSAPFREPAWLILMSLVVGRMPGYAMMEDIRLTETGFQRLAQA